MKIVILDGFTCNPGDLSWEPLLSARNCIITPHHAWATSAARRRLVKVTVDNIKAFVEGKPQNVVNP